MPLARPDLTIVAAAIHTYRIHYQIYAERTFSSQGERFIKISVRLLGALEQERSRLEAIQRALSALSIVARTAVAPGTHAEIESDENALFTSRESAAAGEVHLTLVLPLVGEGVGAENERTVRLTVFRRNLELLGVFSGAYREMPARFAGGDEWEVRPAAAALSTEENP